MRLKIKGSVVPGLLLLFATAAVAGAGAGKQGTLSGRWATDGATPYLQLTAPGVPELFSTTVVWTLSEDPEGVISGTSDFVAFDSLGNEIVAAQLDLVGSGTSRSYAFAQSDLSEPSNTGVTFQCTLRGTSRMTCLGTSTGALSPLSLTLDLRRLEDHDGDSDSDS